MQNTPQKKYSLRLHPARILFLSFVGIILIGTILLSLPAATNGPSLRVVDALFTATSAACVTGLVVVDTGARLTMFGQIVVLMLIQLGGLGIMTFSLLFLYLITRRFSIRGRELLEQTLTQHPSQNLTTLLKSIFIFTFTIELCGALILAFRFAKTYPWGKAVYMGLFHSVSAFCNAGFSLFSNSFNRYSGDPFVNLTVMILIVSGGLGFIVLFDLGSGLRRSEKHKFQYSLHTKVVLATSAVLIVSGAFVIFLLEYSNVLRGAALPDKIFASFFQSITARTAGFTTIPTASLTNASLLVLIGLMFIGASPGSCGGGIKTSTIVILLYMAYARYRDDDDVNIFSRRIPHTAVSKALAIGVFAAMVIVMFVIALSISEQSIMPFRQSEWRFIEILFETVSAFGTVGLSCGITPYLSDVGRIVITILMLIGRLGPLTLAIAIGRTRRHKTQYRFAEDSVLLG